MRVSRVQQSQNFCNNPKKKEFIDVIADNVRNPRDVNDCVAVPRGIFKAYIYLMAGSGLISVANFLPKKLNFLKTLFNISGAVLGFVSAVYFAKPFAIKGLSPTVERK